MRAKANTKLLDVNGHTALQLAEANGHTATTELIDSAADGAAGGAADRAADEVPPKKKPLLPNDVKECLTKCCLENSLSDHPYPNKCVNMDICTSTHLTITSVKDWCVTAMLEPKPAR